MGYLDNLFSVEGKVALVTGGATGIGRMVATGLVMGGARTDKLHILVNNAGITWGEPLETFPHAAWQKVMNVNVGGLFTLTRDLLPLMDAASSDGDPGRVINLGSVMGTVPVA